MSVLDETLKGKRGYGLARVSTIDQRDNGVSLKSQSLAIEAYMVERGLEVLGVPEESFSGFEINRPVLDRLREMALRKEFEVLVFYAVDRMSRNMAHLAILMDFFKGCGVLVRFVTEEFEDTAEGRFLLAVRGFLAEMEGEKIRERSIRNKRQRALDGKVARSGIDMYGYRRVVGRKRDEPDPGVRVIDLAESAIIRRLFQAAAAGWSLRAIAASLNEEGVPTPSADKRKARSGSTEPPRWTHRVVAWLIRRTEYKGVAYRWQWMLNEQGVMVMRDESEWIRLPDGACPAIVDAGQWAAANAAIDGADRWHTRRDEDGPSSFLLRGLIKCALCGRAMTGETERLGRRVYRCWGRKSGETGRACAGRRVLADWAEDIVWTSLWTVLRDPATVRDAVEGRGPTGSGADLLALDLATAASQLETERAGRARVLRVLALAGDDPDADEQAAAELTRRKLIIQRLEVSVVELQAQVTQRGQQVARYEAFEARLARVEANLGEMTALDQREALEALEVKVRAEGEYLEARGRARPGEEETTLGVVGNMGRTSAASAHIPDAIPFPICSITTVVDGPPRL